MNPKFRYYIYTNDDLATKRPIAPTYKDDAAKELEQETNQKFYRAKLSGKMGLIRDDFDFVLSKPFDTLFNFLIERSDDWGETWTTEFLGKFFRTDCTINYDNKKLTFQPEPIDQYTDTLAGLEKEYNLIPLAPEIQPILIQKRPLIQIYIPGQTIVSCFLSGSFWEQDCNEVWDKNALVQTYKFALCNLLKEIQVTANGNFAVGGLYTGRISQSGTSFNGELRSQTNQLYKIVISVTGYQPPFFLGQATAQIRRVSDDVVLYQFQRTLAPGDQWENEDFTFSAVAGSGATGTAGGEMATYPIYARYLLDVDNISGLNTYALPADDIVGYNRNYRRAIGYAMDVAFISTNFSTEPTEWGRADSLLYYMPPYSIWGQKFFPIARSRWRYASIWFGFHMFDDLLEEKGRKTYILKDTFPIHSVIKKLLEQFAPDITHEPTPEYSQFLYGDQNPISYQRFKLFVTQKSNILVGNYQQPAQKAPTTLQQFTNMLRDCFRCFWHIENGKFRIEHVDWYQNGGSYSGTPVIGTDLTTLENVRNGKKWSFGTSEISFDKMDMPERFQFNWADDVTLAFEGLPIEVKSRYVQQGKIEDVNISGFTSDVDMMMLSPDEMGKEGFAIFAAVTANAIVERVVYGNLYTSGTDALTTPTFTIRPELTDKVGYINLNATVSAGGSYRVVFYDSANNVISEQWNVTDSGVKRLQLTIPANAANIGLRATGTVSASFYNLEVPGQYELPFVQRSLDGVDYYLQNGYMAFATLQPNFWTYDLPARMVEINGNTFYANGIERKKKQNLNFPVIGTPNPMQLIKTEIGAGQIDKMSINLHSRSTKTTVKYDTE